MSAIISKSLGDELILRTRELYPGCFDTIKSMYRSRGEKAGVEVTEEQLNAIAERILGKCP